MLNNDLLLKQQLAQMGIDDDDARIDALIDEIEELDSLTDNRAQKLIEELRPHTVTEDVYEEMEEHLTLGARMADMISTYVGSWRFIILFSVAMAAWILLNTYLGTSAFDPAPFILLNLTLSTLAAFQAPVILMAQNRQSEKDRAMAHNDYQVNLKSELEIADLHRKVDELSETIQIQARMMNALLNVRRQELRTAVQLIEKKRTDNSLVNGEQLVS